MEIPYGPCRIGLETFGARLRCSQDLGVELRTDKFGGIGVFAPRRTGATGARLSPYPAEVAVGALNWS